jgi:uncharacterized membrane protein YcaP (DUF421 family)
MDLGAIVVRCVFAYLTLLALLRGSGKRTIAEGTSFDFVLAIVIGDLIDDLLWGEVAAPAFVTATGTLVLAHAALGLSAHRSDALRRLLAGRPAVLARHGERQPRALRAERVNEQEVAELLRRNGVLPADVDLLVVEENGRPSVTRTSAARPLTRRDAAFRRASG